MLFSIIKTIPRIIKEVFFLLTRIRISPDLFREEQVKERFRLKPGWVFIDVGASMGMYTIKAAKQVGKKGFVVAVEPHPESFDFLRFMISLMHLENVKPINIALYEKNTSINLYLGKKPALSSVMDEYDAGLGSVKVRALTLDTLVDILKIDYVDAVKIDVEGAELKVLKGMKKTIKTCKFITIELHGKPAERDEVADYIKSLLEGEGFITDRFGMRKKHIMGVKQ